MGECDGHRRSQVRGREFFCIVVYCMEGFENVHRMMSWIVWIGGSNFIFVCLASAPSHLVRVWWDCFLGQ